MAAHQQVQPTGHNDQNSAAAQRPSHITGQQVDGTVRRQAAGRQGGVVALGQHHSGAAEKCQHCTRCRVGRHVSRPCQRCRHQSHRRRVEGVVPLSAERFFDKHGNDRCRDHHIIRGRSRHHQHNQRSKSFAGRLMCAVARRMQRGNNTVRHIRSQQPGRHHQQRARPVIKTTDRQKRDSAKQNVPIIIIVYTFGDLIMTFWHGYSFGVTAPEPVWPARHGPAP